MNNSIAPFALVALSLLASCSDESSGAPSRAGAIIPSAAFTDSIIETIERDGGLVIEIFEQGKGPAAQEMDRVTAHYRGWIQGTEEIFDSSFQRSNPFSFTIGQHRVIRGWELGFEGLSAGTRARLLIPSQLGYGEAGQGSIPSNADLVFDVELVGIRDL